MKHIDEEGLLREQVEHLGENKFKGAIQPMLQNLTKEMEFFEREENKESMHKLLNLYNERHHPYQRYVVTTMFKTKAVSDTYILFPSARSYDNIVFVCRIIYRKEDTRNRQTEITVSTQLKCTK